MKHIPMLVFCLLLAGLGWLAGNYWHSPGDNADIAIPQDRIDIPGATVLDAPRKLPALQLQNHESAAVSTSQADSRWQLYNFGFTRCPDVCPTELARLSTVSIAAFGAGFDQQFQVSFVTLDPETDNPKRLSQYIAYFDPKKERIRGLTGERAQLEALAAAMGIAHSRTAEDNPGQFNIDHGTAYVLVDPEQRIRAYILPPHETNQVSETVLALLEHFTVADS